MKSYYNCNAFENEAFEVKPEFSVLQSELVLKKLNKNNSASFAKEKVEYKCKWKKQDNFDSEKPTIIIPTRNMKDLIKKTITNLEDNSITKHCNLIVVDDRSDQDIKSVIGSYSYLRIDNDRGFSFSMLNNIAALICHKLKCSQIILWNNDLWTVNESSFLEFLRRHNESSSVVSGSKLLYPPKEVSFTKEEDSENILEAYPQFSGKWRKTIQYAGTSFLSIMPRVQTLSPYHYKRFGDPKDPRVNCDKGTSALTGALLIIELSCFIVLGGLNPSLAKNYQDTDFCLKVLENQQHCYYFGKDLFFYHDESISLAGSKIKDNQLLNDEVLFGKIWNDRISQLVI